MKFLRFSMMDVADIPKVAQASDKVMANPPTGFKMLSNNACMGIAFPGQPANTLVAVATVEAESADVLAAASYPLTIAGASVWVVPVLDVPVAGSTEVEKKMRG